MSEGLFNSTIWYCLIVFSVLISSFLGFKYRLKYIEHMILPFLCLITICVLVLSITVGGETYKYISDSLAVIWLVSNIIALFSLRRINRG